MRNPLDRLSGLDPLLQRPGSSSKLLTAPLPRFSDLLGLEEIESSGGSLPELSSSQRPGLWAWQGSGIPCDLDRLPQHLCLITLALVGSS